MKKHIITVLAAVAALMTLSTSCLKEERSDVMISYSVLLPEVSYIGFEDVSSILSQIGADSKKVESAFLLGGKWVQQTYTYPAK